MPAAPSEVGEALDPIGLAGHDQDVVGAGDRVRGRVGERPARRLDADHGDAVAAAYLGVAQRQALAVALIGLGAVVLATMAITAQSGLPLSRTLFEAFSAFGTVGLTTGITAELPVASQNILILLMFLGRTGPITLATALALREREPRYRYPEERPIIG